MLKLWKQIINFKYNSIRFRLIKYFLILVLVPIISISVITFFSSSMIINNKVNRYEKATLSQIRKNIEFRLDQINYVASSILVNKEVQSILREYKYMTEDQNTSDAYLILTKFVNGYLFSTNYIRSILITSEKGDNYSFGDYLAASQEDFAQIKEMMGNMLKNRQSKWEYFSKDQKMTIGRYNSISYLASIKDYNKGGTSLGYLIINTSDFVLNDIFNKKNLDEYRYYVVVDGRGDPIYSYNPNNYSMPIRFLSENLSNIDSYTIKSVNNTKYAISYENIGNTDWRLISVTPVAEYLKDVNFIRNIIIITGILSFLLAIYLNMRFSRNISYPIYELIGNMIKVQNGDFNVQSKIISNDEIGQIQEIFNSMIYRIKGLINKVYEEEREKRYAELNALQAQMNPHFLYNTLNSVNCIAKLHNEEDISRIVVSLSDLLRISVSKKGEYILLREEVEYVNKYLIIQNIRYRDKFTAIFDIEDSLKEKKILKLLLQPLVENCIYHGLETLETKGEIRINAYEDKGDILIKVKDNGVGLEEDKLLRMNEAFKNYRDDNQESIGVRNVNARIKLHFADKYGLQFYNNIEGPGLTVELRVPVLDN